MEHRQRLTRGLVGREEQTDSRAASPGRLASSADLRSVSPRPISWKIACDGVIRSPAAAGPGAKSVNSGSRVATILAKQQRPIPQEEMKALHRRMRQAHRAPSRSPPEEFERKQHPSAACESLILHSESLHRLPRHFSPHQTAFGSQVERPWPGEANIQAEDTKCASRERTAGPVHEFQSTWKQSMYFRS